MSNVKFELNIPGFNDLRKSEKVMEECRKYADRVSAAAGEGFKVEARHYPDRNGFVVFPDTPKAIARNLRENSLLKALH